MNIDILLGKTNEHLVPLEGTQFLVHHLMLQDFLRLQHSAKKSGLDLQVASAFRHYDRQLMIWNAKAKGARVLLDEQERPLDYSSLSATEIVFAILRWSAIPGLSRHHWGSDIDVFDGFTQARDEVKLTPSECVSDGPSGKLHLWLDQQMSCGQSFGFFRPYVTDRKGVCPERWHLSYFPVSRRMMDHYTFSIFKRHVEESEILFKEIILEHAEDIFYRFFVNIDLP